MRVQLILEGIDRASKTIRAVQKAVKDTNAAGVVAAQKKARAIKQEAAAGVVLAQKNARAMTIAGVATGKLAQSTDLYSKAVVKVGAASTAAFTQVVDNTKKAGAATAAFTRTADIAAAVQSRFGKHVGVSGIAIDQIANSTRRYHTAAKAANVQAARGSALFAALAAGGRGAANIMGGIGSGIAEGARPHLTKENIKESRGAAVANAQAALVPLAAVGAAVTKAAMSFATFEDALLDIGLKTRIFGAELTAFGQRVRAQSEALNMSSTDLLKGIDKLAAGGLSMDVAEKAFPAIAKAALATKATIEDLSTATVSLSNNLKVAPGDIVAALDAMAAAGAAGRFELKDMARYFPKLGSLYAGMGQTGVKAVGELSAMLQATIETSGNAEGAAAALRDVMSKITGDQAVKAFKKAGIDIEKVMAKARKEGRVMEAIHDSLMKATGGDVSLLNKFFGDVEAQNGARAFMQQWEKFLEARKAAQDSKGMIDADFDRRMKLIVEMSRNAARAFEELSASVGEALKTDFIEKLDWTAKALKGMKTWADANQETVRLAAKIIAGLLAARVAIFLLQAAFWILIGPLKWLAPLFKGLGIAALFLGRMAFTALAWSAAKLAVGLRLLGPALLLASRAMLGFGLTLMTTPVGWFIAGVAAIAGAAYLIYRNWNKIGPWFAKLWAGIKTKAKAAWTSMIAWFSTLGGEIADAIKTGWDTTIQWFANLGNEVVTAMSEGWKAVTTFFENLKPFEAIQKAFDGFIQWIAGWGKSITDAFGKVFDEISGFIDDKVQKVQKTIKAVTTAVSDAYNWALGPKNTKALKDSLPSDPASLERVAAATTTIHADINAIGKIDTSAALAKTAEIGTKATEVITMIRQIGPAAQAAVNAAVSILSATSFYEHGVRLMTTLAAGIRAGSAAAVAAVRDTVQKMRDHLPHSPAKVGPLSDLHRVRFSETLALAVRNGMPQAVRAASVVAAGMASAVQPSFASPDAATFPGRAAGSAGREVTVNLTFNPQVTMNGKGDTAELEAQLKKYAHEITELVQRELERRRRTEH